MSAFAKTLSLVLTSMVLVSCAYSPPSAHRSVSINRTIDLPFEVAWDKTAQVLASSGLAIITAAKDSGVITTAAQPQRVTSAHADCGNVLGFPYVQDQRTVTRVGYSLLLKSAAQKTEITINATIDGVFNAYAGASTTSLACVSQGALENELLDKIVVVLNQG